HLPGSGARHPLSKWRAHFRRQHYPPRGLARYGDRSITKWDIFHYIYAVLHHPEYRQRYSANLRRELPRIPFVSATPGAKAQVEGAPNAALKRRSSTVTSSRSTTVTSSSSMVTSSNA